MNRHCIENDNSTIDNVCYDCDICDGNNNNNNNNNNIGENNCHNNGEHVNGNDL